MHALFFPVLPAYNAGFVCPISYVWGFSFVRDTVPLLFSIRSVPFSIRSVLFFPFAPFFFFHSLRSVYHSPLWTHICAQFRSAKLRPYAPHMPTWQCRLLRQLVGQSHCPLVLSLPPSCSSGITCASVSHKSNLTPQRVRNQSLPKDHRKIPQGSPKDEPPFLHKSRSHCIYTMYIYIFCYKVAINSTIYHPLVFLYPRTNLLFSTFLLEKCKKMQKYLVNSKKSSNFAAVLCA